MFDKTCIEIHCLKYTVLCLGPAALGTSLALMIFFEGPFDISKGLQYVNYIQSWFIIEGHLGPMFYVERVISDFRLANGP